MNNATLEKLLGIAWPWSVLEVEVNDAENLLDVHVGLPRSGWLTMLRSVSRDGVRTFVWRHLGVGALRCRIRLDCPAEMPIPDGGWAGQDDSPFTHALSQRILILLGNGASLALVSSTFDVDPQEVWRFKRRLDTGRVGAAWSGEAAPAQNNAAPQRPAAPTATPTLGTEAEPQRATAGIDLPEVEHGIWRELLNGNLSIDIRNLGLQLLLARLRAQFAVARDEDTRNLKVLELRRYCEKNINVATREIQQIRAKAQ